MYWYLKNVRNEIISRNNLDDISRNSEKYREISRKKAQRNFAEFSEIKMTFVVISYFAK
jgi:hypothetical protein